MAFNIFLLGFRGGRRRGRRERGVREESLAKLLEEWGKESWGVESGVDEVMQVPVLNIVSIFFSGYKK